MRHSDTYIALNSDSSSISDEIDQLKRQGYRVVSDSIKSLDSEMAIENWKASCWMKNEIKKKPIDIANENIRKANKEIAVLEEMLLYSNSKNETLQSIILELSKKNESQSLMIEKLTNYNKRLEENILEIKSNNINNFTPTDQDILGFASTQEKTSLKRRYLKLSQIYHPDTGGSKIMMQYINDAYNRLKRI